MMLDPAIIVLGLICLSLAGYLFVHDRSKIGEALVVAGRQGRILIIRVPLAILAASLIGRLIPTTYVSNLIGQESGIVGVLIASFVGAFIPGGPMLSFPLALVVWQLGAGQAQMVAFLASWSIFAVHRMISYELPLLGGRFVIIRMASSWMLPFLAGLIAMGMLMVWHGGDPPPRDTGGPSAAHGAAVGHPIDATDDLAFAKNSHIAGQR